MLRWEYCEIEVVYRGSGAEAALYLLRADGSHAQSTGRYGEMMAALGLEGWELAGAAGVRTRDNPILKLFFRRGLQNEGVK